MWQLGINTKFHQESRSFIFRPRLLLQRGAEYYVTTLIAQAMALIASNQHPEYEVDVPSCFISPETCRGSSGHSLYATPIKNPESSNRRTPLSWSWWRPITGHGIPTECLVIFAPMAQHVYGGAFRPLDLPNQTTRQNHPSSLFGSRFPSPKFVGFKRSKNPGTPQ